MFHKLRRPVYHNSFNQSEFKLNLSMLAMKRFKSKRNLQIVLSLLQLHMVPGEDRLRTHDRMEALRQEIGDFETPEVRKRKTVIPFLF